MLPIYVQSLSLGACFENYRGEEYLLMKEENQVIKLQYNKLNISFSVLRIKNRVCNKLASSKSFFTIYEAEQHFASKADKGINHCGASLFMVTLTLIR